LYICGKFNFSVKNSAKQMKNKVLAAIKPLLADKGLKTEELKNLADVVIREKGLTDESTDEQISNAIGDGSVLKQIAAIIQQAASSADTAAAARVAKKYEGWINPNEPQPQPKPTPKPTPTPAPQPKDAHDEQIAKLIEQISKQQEQINTLNAAAVQRSKEIEAARLQSLLAADERIKKMPTWFAERYKLDKEENLESVAAKAESEWAQAKQELYKRDDFAAPPTGGAFGGGSGSQQDGVFAFLKQVGDYNKAQAQAAANK
jgi:uncharacterized coiled-coil protein SlyX